MNRKFSLLLLFSLSTLISSCGKSNVANDIQNFEGEAPGIQKSIKYDQTVDPEVNPNWPIVKKGHRGDQVRTAQHFLRQHGIADTGKADGIFGKNTKNSVITLQKNMNIKADGIIGKNTWEKLIVIVKQGSRGEAVKAVQTSLGLKADGIFGQNTKNSVIDFQKSKGLNADGIVGKNTWKALLNHGFTTRQSVVSRGRAWVNANIPYSQTKFHKGWRTDCSGFVSMAWNLRDPKGGKISATTATMKEYTDVLSGPDQLKPGDAVNSAHKHIVLFVKWEDKSKKIFTAYEERGKKWGTVKHSRQLVYKNGSWKMKGSEDREWHFLRFKNLVDPALNNTY